jgi:Mitochondrial domain of unknown function (DUF1713)
VPRSSKPGDLAKGALGEESGASRSLETAPNALISPAGRLARSGDSAGRSIGEVSSMGSVIKKRRKRMAKKKHRKLLKKTRVQRRNKK